MTDVVIGLGLTRAATPAHVRATGDAALASVGLGWADVVVLATTVRLRDHPAVHALVDAEDLEVAWFEPSRLARVTVPNPSAAVGERAGTTSVAEAAALLAAGAEVLLVPKLIGPGVTVALAELTPA